MKLRVAHPKRFSCAFTTKEEALLTPLRIARRPNCCDTDFRVIASVRTDVFSNRQGPFAPPPWRTSDGGGPVALHRGAVPVGQRLVHHPPAGKQSPPGTGNPVPGVTVSPAA